MLLIILCGCEHRIVPPEDTGRPATPQDTDYAEILPPLGKGIFVEPYAIMVGKDQLIYVADYGLNEIIMMDVGGTILTRRSIPHPISIAQNSKLDLYIGGDTISADGIDTIGAIYKISLVRWDTTYYDTLPSSLGLDSIVAHPESTLFNHDLEHAHMRIVYQEPERKGRKYVGIGILPSNEYLVARVGSDSLGNSSFVDPDSRVLYFGPDDSPRGPRIEFATKSTGGSYITDINNLTGLLVLQTNTYPSSYNFVLTQSIQGVAYGAIYMVYSKTNDFEGWLPGYDPAKPAQQNVDFLKIKSREAAGAAYDNSRGELFIVDAGFDSVFKFDRKGMIKHESFGKFKTTHSNMAGGNDIPGLLRPRGVAYSNDCTLYVADTGNGIIRRFRLATQTRCYR